jgi:hypothetical protein
MIPTTTIPNYRTRFDTWLQRMWTVCLGHERRRLAASLRRPGAGMEFLDDDSLVSG